MCATCAVCHLDGACVLRVLYVCVLHACMYVLYVLHLCSVLWMCVLYRMYRKYRGLVCNTVPFCTSRLLDHIEQLVVSCAQPAYPALTTIVSGSLDLLLKADGVRSRLLLAIS